MNILLFKNLTATASDLICCKIISDTKKKPNILYNTNILHFRKWTLTRAYTLSVELLCTYNKIKLLQMCKNYSWRTKNRLNPK